MRIEAFAEHNEALTHIRDGDKTVFKYIDFKNNPESISLHISSGKNGGTIVVSSDKPCTNNWRKSISKGAAKEKMEDRNKGNQRYIRDSCRLASVLRKRGRFVLN
ncbi:MAG: hypothetical protein K9H65_02735 [Bacteroidales bacterium]|nr:hypothetical protein [Bacteroidales bacterium]